MVAEYAVWSRVIKPDARVELELPANLLITGAALGAKLDDPKGRTSVILKYFALDLIGSDASESGDESSEAEAEEKPDTAIVLCSLTPEKTEQCTLNVKIPEQSKLYLEVVGKNEIHMVGNFINEDDDLSPDDEDYDSDEDGYALDEVSSDVEIDPAMLDDAELDDSDEEHDDSHRFEEIIEDKKDATASANKKRPRESDAEGSEVEKLSKKQQKKLSKKMKAENGDAAAPAVSESAKKDKKAEGKHDKAEKTEKKEKVKEEKDMSGEEMKTLSSGLKLQDKKLGKGKTVKKGDMVSMRYIGKLQNGKTFDSNVKGKPFTFRVGAGEVIKGWDEGIVGMAAGGERLLIVPPKLGYGSQKMSDIPPNSTLRFETKLIEIKH